MNAFKTPKGTQLPFLRLQGKDYLQIMHRLVWFREDHPDWSLVTEIQTHNDAVAVVLAKILDAQGRVLAVGHKQQTAKGFAAYLEKAESGAIGRALAFLGYGTAHAQELEEDESTPMNELADSPAPSTPSFKGGGPSLPQLNRLYAIYMANGWTPQDVQGLMLKKFGFTVSAQLNKAQYEELCDYLQKNKPNDGNIS